MNKRMKPTNKFRRSNRMLLDERPLVLLPSLAKAVGIAGAVVVQQVHFHLANPNNGRIHDGEQWIFKTYEDWHKDDFPFWSERTIRRIFSTLEKGGMIISCQPEGCDSRRKYYRIDYEQFDRLDSLARAQEAAKSGASIRPKVALPLIRDDSTEITLKGKGALTPLRCGRTVSVFVPYPESSDEMYDTLERLGISIDPDHDGNFFEQMQASGWTIKGEPVFDWPATYQGR
jgi:hypothetical protein